MSCTARCFYCDSPLSQRHEHDHFPKPERCDGNQTVCACINCHDLKDRIPLADWPETVTVEILAIWPKLTTVQRLFMAKMLALCFDMAAQRRG